MAGASRSRLLQLPRGADQLLCTARLPAPRHRYLAAHAAASQPKGSDHLGTDDEAGERLAPETNHPSSMAERSLCRQPPEVGAVCGKVARTVLCGGRSVMSVPTATNFAPQPKFGGDRRFGSHAADPGNMSRGSFAPQSGRKLPMLVHFLTFRSLGQ